MMTLNIYKIDGKIKLRAINTWSSLGNNAQSKCVYVKNKHVIKTYRAK